MLFLSEQQLVELVAVNQVIDADKGDKLDADLDEIETGLVEACDLFLFLAHHHECFFESMELTMLCIPLVLAQMVSVCINTLVQYFREVQCVDVGALLVVYLLLDVPLEVFLQFLAPLFVLSSQLTFFRLFLESFDGLVKVLLDLLLEVLSE